jgi:hypothetical protein
MSLRDLKQGSAIATLWMNECDFWPALPRSPLAQVALRERAARTGLEIALQRNGADFVCKFDYDVELPRESTGRVTTSAGIVVGEAQVHVGRHVQSAGAQRNVGPPTVRCTFARMNPIERRWTPSHDLLAGVRLVGKYESWLATRSSIHICGPPSLA